MTRRRRQGTRLIILFGVLSWAAAGTARAQWEQYGPGKRYEALQNYQRYRELPKKKQKEIQRQYQRWQEMPDDERERIRKNYERFQSMPPGKKSEVESRSRALGKKKPPRD
jgi:predicted Fe-S protein YdhL (DUF1289 family)